MNDENDLLINKIKKLMPHDNHRIRMIMTLMGMSATLVEFIMSEHKAKDLPVMIRYACANICGNMIALISDSENLPMHDLSGDSYEMSEQTQERIYQKMKEIILILYKMLKEDEKV